MNRRKLSSDPEIFNVIILENKNMSQINKVSDSFLESLYEFLDKFMPVEEKIELLKVITSTAYSRDKIILSSRLSSREQACLYLAALGKSTRETGDILEIKLTTVATHRKKILRKLACKNMAQAVFLWYAIWFNSIIYKVIL